MSSQNHGYRWFNFVLSQRLLRETDSRPITCIVRERQLQLYGHVAHYREVDPAQRVLSVWDIPVWRRPRGRPQLLWLEQVDESCQELLRMGRGPAWRLARRNPRVWRRRVCDATHPPAYAPFDWLIDGTSHTVKTHSVNKGINREKLNWAVRHQIIPMSLFKKI